MPPTFTYNPRLLLKLITESGLSIPRLSEATHEFIDGGISRKTIDRMITDEGNPRLENINAVMNALAKVSGHNDVNRIKDEIEFKPITEDDNIILDEVDYNIENDSDSKSNLKVFDSNYQKHNSSTDEFSDSNSTLTSNNYLKDVFLLHTISDKYDYINHFISLLEGREISYCLNEAEIKLEKTLHELISIGLSKSRFVLVFISKDLLSRNGLKAALKNALNYERPKNELNVLPIIVGEYEKCLKENPFLKEHQFFKWESDFNQIVEELEKVLGRHYNESWVFEYPTSFKGDIWIKIVPSIENRKLIHNYSIKWGEWKNSGNIDFKEDNSVILNFGKMAREETYPFEFEISPKAFVSSGRGNTVVDISKGWKCLNIQENMKSKIYGFYQHFLSDRDIHKNAKIEVNK